MKKLICAAVAATFFAGVVLAPNQASAGATPVAAAGGIGAAGGAIGIIGVAGFFAIYDFLRRTTCIGDPLKLGGPGFGEPIRPGMNVLPPPACKQRH
jgi:hypothetical protein